MNDKRNVTEFIDIITQDKAQGKYWQIVAYDSKHGYALVKQYDNLKDFIKVIRGINDN